MINHYDLVVIGCSSAGIAAVEKARKARPEIRIACFSEETDLPYYRPMLTEYLGNPEVVKKASFQLKKESWFSDMKVDWFPGCEVTDLDPGTRTLRCAGGQECTWEACVLAVGSMPFVPLPEALELPGVHTCRTLEDSRRIHELAGNSRHVVIIGGGLLGLEAAHFLNAPDRQVTVIELLPRILPRQLDEKTSAWFFKTISATGVDVRLGTKVAGIHLVDGKKVVSTDSGESIAADLVLFSIGVRPRVDLALKAGLQVNRGIVVNEHLQTSDPRIFACGDVAEFAGVSLPLWMPALKMGQIAGHNAVSGCELIWTTPMAPAALSAFGTRIFSVGTLEGEEMEFLQGPDTGIRLFLRDGMLAGAVLWGDTAKGMALARAMERQATTEEVREMLQDSGTR